MWKTHKPINNPQQPHISTISLQVSIERSTQIFDLPLSVLSFICCCQRTDHETTTAALRLLLLPCLPPTPSSLSLPSTTTGRNDHFAVAGPLLLLSPSSWPREFPFHLSGRERTVMWRCVRGRLRLIGQIYFDAINPLTRRPLK